MVKKIITWVVIILFILSLLFLLYFFFFVQKAHDDPDERERSELFNPFGDALPSTGFDRDDFDSQIYFDGKSKLKQITSTPVSGFEIYIEEEDVQTSTTTPENTKNKEIVVFKYVERSTGHIYETTFDSLDNKRISNVTIPKNYYSIFLNEGKNIIYRFLSPENHNTIRTYLSEFNYITSTSTEADIFTQSNSNGIFLMDNITQIINSPADQVFGLVSNKSTSGFNSVGFLIDFDNLENINVILESEVSEWNADWVDENTISLTTRAGYKYDGFSYLLNVNTGTLSRVLGPLPGLLTKYSPDGKYLFYSTSNSDNTSSFIYNLSTNELKKTFLNSLADKCTWTLDSSSIFCGAQISIPPGAPDAWYKGIHSYNDTIISYNIETDNFSIFNEYDYNLNNNLDIKNIKISENNDFILFQNKLDLSLWAYDLRLGDY